MTIPTLIKVAIRMMRTRVAKIFIRMVFVILLIIMKIKLKKHNNDNNYYDNGNGDKGYDKKDWIMVIKKTIIMIMMGMLL